MSIARPTAFVRSSRSVAGYSDSGARSSRYRSRKCDQLPLELTEDAAHGLAFGSCGGQIAGDSRPRRQARIHARSAAWSGRSEFDPLRREGWVSRIRMRVSLAQRNRYKDRYLNSEAFGEIVNYGYVRVGGPLCVPKGTQSCNGRVQELADCMQW